MQLLMIEDDERLAGMVADYLSSSGYDVSHAPDAQSGLAQHMRSICERAGVDPSWIGFEITESVLEPAMRSTIKQRKPSSTPICTASLPS